MTPLPSDLETIIKNYFTPRNERRLTLLEKQDRSEAEQTELLKLETAVDACMRILAPTDYSAMVDLMVRVNEKQHKELAAIRRELAEIKKIVRLEDDYL